MFRTLAIALSLLVSAPAWAQDAPTPVAEAAAAVPVEENLLDLYLSTGGKVRIQLFPNLAPGHVARIKELTRAGFYDGVVFHRVIEGFMAQTGDPTGTGAGDSDLPDLEAEFNGYPHIRGTVSMARTAEENSANSQFFIVFYPRFALDGKYTVFGRVIDGMQYVDAVQRGEPPANPSRIVMAAVAADGRQPPSPSALVEQRALPDTPVTIDDLNAPLDE